MASVLEKMRNIPKVVTMILALEHGATILTPHLQGFVVAAKGTIPSLLKVPILQTAGLMDINTAPESVRGDDLWPNGVSCPGTSSSCVHAAKLTVVSLLREVLYALKALCVPERPGQWSRANLELVHAALGVWAVGLEDSLIQRLATLAVILGDVCLVDACDDACHLAKYMVPHVLFCETVRAVHDVVRSSTEVTLAYLASAGPGAAGALGVGSAGSGAFRAGMLAAGKDPSDPAAVAAAKGSSAGSGAFRAGMLAAGKDPSDPAAVAAAKGGAHQPRSARGCLGGRGCCRAG